MPHLRLVLTWLAILASASAQSYVVNTLAGKGKLAYAGDGSAANTVNLFSPYRVAFDAAGNLYFTEDYYQRVFKVNAAGALSVVAGNGEGTYTGEGGPATSAGLPSPLGIAADAAGNLYVGTNGRLCRISGGRIRTIAGNGTGGYTGDRGQAGAALIHTPDAIAVDAAGNIWFSDMSSNVVRKISPDGTIDTVAGTGTPGYNGDGIAGTSAQLNGPQGLAVDATGNLYIADRFNHRVRKLAPNGILTTFAGTGQPGNGGTGFAKGAQLFQPNSVAVDAATGFVYIADTTNGLLRMVDPGGVISSYATALGSISDVAVSPAGWVAVLDFLNCVIKRVTWTSTSIPIAVGLLRTAALGDGGAAANAYFVDPWGLAVDPAGNLYVADNGDQRIRKIGTDLKISTAAGTGVFGSSVDGQAGTISAIAQPRALAADGAGNLYFNSACQIRMLLKTGTVKTVVGNGNCAYGGENGPALDAQLQFPQGLAYDLTGYLYIADSDNNRIRKVNLSSGVITLLAGNGTPGYAGNGTSAQQAQLNLPVGLAVDSKGNVYFADENNHRVRRIDSSGIIHDFAGNGNCDSPKDGPAAQSTLCYPTAVAVDASGNVWIADSGYIRRVGTDGKMTVVAGSGTLGMANEGEPALSAGMAPFYLVLDARGRVCFSDWMNLRIRCLDAATSPPPPSGPTVTVVNAATFLTGPVAPGEIVTIYGTGMGPAVLVSASLDSTGPPLATTLANAQVTFDGVAAPLLYVSATQSSAIVPFSVAGKSTTAVQANYQGKSAGTATVSAAAASPGLFTMASSGSGPGAILNQDWSVNAAANPAARGDVLMLFGTGGGVTSPGSVDGQYATVTYANLALPVTVTIGNANGTVLYAGAAPNMVAGVFQINVQVPQGAPVGGQVPIVVTCGGVPSPATVTVAVK